MPIDHKNVQKTLLWRAARAIEASTAEKTDHVHFAILVPGKAFDPFSAIMQFYTTRVGPRSIIVF